MDRVLFCFKRLREEIGGLVSVVLILNCFSFVYELIWCFRLKLVRSHLSMKKCNLPALADLSATENPTVNSTRGKLTSSGLHSMSTTHFSDDQ